MRARLSDQWHSWVRRQMARYLRKHGWVVFYLDPAQRTCHSRASCWMKAYQHAEPFL